MDSAKSGNIRPEDIVLPADGVLFIGGHENFISKLKQAYPGWTYLNPEERNSLKVKGDFKLVVAKTDHLSHNILERAYAYVSRDIPTVYTKSTNINRALLEIKEGYAKVLCA